MKRYFMAFIGVVFIGFSVAVLNLSGFGGRSIQLYEYVSERTSPIFVWRVADFCKCSDPYAACDSRYKRKKGKIGAIFGFGTLWNMTGVGLLVDFLQQSIIYFSKSSKSWD